MIHERLTSQQGAAQAREAIPKIFSAADQIFTEIIDRDPGFAEVCLTAIIFQYHNSNWYPWLVD